MKINNLKNITLFWGLAFPLICIIAHNVYSQDTLKGSHISLSSIVCDSLNKQPLPLVKVYNTNKRTGTTTTFDGTFKLDNFSINDSITFYTLGFIKQGYIIKELFKLDTIFLAPETQLIDEVVVLADNSILYNLISNCTQNRQSSNLIAKTYLEIESFNEKDQVELIQGYYNGYFNGYDLKDLKTKNVRFGLLPKEERVYTSINTSKIFYEHQLFEKDNLFPLNPFQFNKWTLKKKYNLVLNSKFKQANNTIYVVSFNPLDQDEDLFSGKVWIDSTNGNIQKVTLEIKNAKKYPFEAIWGDGLLSNVDLKITKSFQEENDITKTNFIDFEYSLQYKASNDSSINIKTHSTLQVYDYSDSFIEPFIEFSNDREMSRQLSELYIINYDPLFWNCIDEYKSSSDESKNNSFFNDSLTISNYELLNTQKFINQSTVTSFKSFYTIWNNKSRIYIKELGSDTSVSRNLQGAIPSEHYNLSAQIYLDINNACDSIYFTTKTIFDPFKTYYHYPITIETLVFINIYFDIIEIQRRKLDKSLKICPQDVNIMKAKYFELINETNQLTKKYFSEVNRGINKNQLEKWNNYVKSEINIDNLNLFIGE